MSALQAIRRPVAVAAALVLVVLLANLARSRRGASYPKSDFDESEVGYESASHSLPYRFRTYRH